MGQVLIRPCDIDLLAKEGIIFKKVIVRDYVDILGNPFSISLYLVDCPNISDNLNQISGHYKDNVFIKNGKFYHQTLIYGLKSYPVKATKPKRIK